MHALDGGDVRDAARLQPIEEFHGGARIGAARVRIADIGGEEFKEAIGGALADGGDEGGGSVDEDDELVHARCPNSRSRTSSSVSSGSNWLRGTILWFGFSALMPSALPFVCFATFISRMSGNGSPG